MTKPTEKVYLKKFYMAIGIVVRDRKSYVKNLDLGEWAPPPACRSSATPPPPPLLAAENDSHLYPCRACRYAVH